MSLGAGWMKSDYEQSGIPYDPPGVRVSRFAESVTIVKGLLGSPGPCSFAGDHYTITDHVASPRPVQQPRPPLVIGAGARRMLTLAGREADIVSINVDLREGLGGPETAPNGTPERTRQKVAWVKEAAGARFDDIELNALIGFVHITDDRTSLLEAMAPAFGVGPDEALHAPLALVGTIEEMAEELEWRRAEFGISYWSFETDCWETLGPLVARLAGT